MRAVSFSRLTDDVLALYGPSMRARSTFLAMAQAGRELAAVPGVRRSSDLTVTNIARWIELHPGRSVARTESLLRCIRIIANFAVSEGWLRASPFGFRPVKKWRRADADEKPKTVRHKTAADIRTLLRLLDSEAGANWDSSRLQALVYVYVYTALRRDEALHILAENVDPVRKTLTVCPVDVRKQDGRVVRWRPKTVRSARTLPMAEPLADVLRAWLPRCGSRWLFPGRRLRGPWMGGPGYKPIDWIRDAAERAGVGDMTIIGFRKSFGTYAKAIGLGPLEVAAILGHTNTETQAHYDEEQIESLRPAMKKITLFFAAAGT